jgi:CHASE2 domain-containing sensor protein
VVYQLGGVFIFICALAAIAMYTILRTRKPDMKKPGVSSFLTLSGMSMVGVGLMLHGNPVSPMLIALGAFEYFTGVGIYFFNRSRSGD